MSVHFPQGRYICTVINQALSEAGTGTPQIVIRFRVLEHENGDQVSNQYERTAYLFITDKTAERTVAILKKLGYTRDSFRFLDKAQPNYHDLSNVEFVGFCTYEKDLSGQERERWGIDAGESEFEAKPLESKKLREIDNLFGKALKAGAKPAAPPPPRTAANHKPEDNIPPSAPVDFEDVPF